MAASANKKKKTSYRKVRSPYKPSFKNSSPASFIRQPLLLAYIMAGIILFVIGFVLWRRTRHSTSSMTSKLDAFQSWFQQQGGWISPLLTVGETAHGNGLLVAKGAAATRTIIHKHDKILEIPLDLIMTQQSAMTTLSTSLPTKTQAAGGESTLRQLEHVIQKYYPTTSDSSNGSLPPSLEQQDVWIALALMHQCSLGSASRYAPYLAILPSKQVPRLATFDDEQLAMLQDDTLAHYGGVQRQALQGIYREGGVARLALVQNDEQQQQHAECWSAASFHHYVSIAASRAMILKTGIKYLTPMAEMINHAPNTDGDDKEVSSSFHEHHYLDETRAVMLVTADRTFRPGQELTEEYGKLDNSLYISAFGFVPIDNPHHCVMVSLPNSNNNNNNQNGKDVDEICVKSNGRALNQDQEEALTRAVLLGQNYCSEEEEDEEACSSIHPPSNNDDESRDLRVRRFLQKAARQRLAEYPTTLAEDEAILANLVRTSSLSTTSPGGGGDRGSDMDAADRVRVAVLFRIEEKKVWTELTR